MKITFIKEKFLQITILFYSLIVVFFYLFNPQGLMNTYGSGNGRYADKIDSFSEYLVRNTIERNVLNKNNSSVLLIVTKGYPKNDYTYYPDAYHKYYSNLGLQTIPATTIAKALRINTGKNFDVFFKVLRLINALFLATLLVSIFCLFCKKQKINHTFLLPLLIGCSSGFILFSQNLYFASALMVMPAFFIAIQLSKKESFNKAFLVFLGMLYFLRGYEFSTIFALLTAFSAALFTTGNLWTKTKSSFVAFYLICFAFLLSALLHIIIIYTDSGSTLSIGESIRTAFSNVEHRTASLDGVPVPFSSEFINTIVTRWNSPAFSIIPDRASLSEKNIIILMIITLLLRLKTITNTEKIIYLYAFLSYVSCYIFSYQHIMWHARYESYIFSLTLGISFSMLVLYYCSLTTNFLQTLRNR
jgi:hypothetical protein